VMLKTTKNLYWWGYKVEKNFDDIFVGFDKIPACDGQTDT